MSRSMLVTRLRELEHAGIVTSEPTQGGDGRRYLLTLAEAPLRVVANNCAGVKPLVRPSRRRDQSLLERQQVPGVLEVRRLAQKGCNGPCQAV